ncbi:MAG TPA: translation initiation factor IF-2, partial [Planctomycetota bacterium]|nr:translation initiation factor IF-2 [Planctomycetota bacterium]
MSKVRLYHLARNWDVSPRDIIDTLNDKGRRFKSHFVEVDSSEVPEIRAILQEAGFFGKPAAPATAVAEAPPPPPPAPPAVERAEAAPPPPPPRAVERAEAPKAAERVEAPKPAAERPEAPKPEPELPKKAKSGRQPVATDGSAKPAVAEKPEAPKPVEKPEAPKPAAKPAAAAAEAPRPAAAEPPKPAAAPAPAAPRAPVHAPAAPVRPAAQAPQAPTHRPTPPVMGAPRTGGPTASSPQAQPQRPAAPAGPPRPAPPSIGGPHRPGFSVSKDDPDFRPGRIIRREEPRPGGPPPVRTGPGAPFQRGPGGPPGRPGDRFGPPGRPMGPGRGPGGPGGPRYGPGGRTDYAMPEIRARTDIPVTPNLRGDEESRRRSRFGPAAPGRGARVPGAPGSGTPGEGGGEDGPGASRTSISPAKKGKQATRRSGPGGSTGAGRRMERRMHERDRWKRASTKRKRTIKAGPVNRPTECSIDLPISIKDLSAKFAVRVADIMQILMAPPHNLMLNINAPVPEEAIRALADHFKIAVEINEEVDVDDATVKELEKVYDEEKEEDLVSRQPVVAVLGHVDHGKTSLLDKIRQTKVAEGEAGGITQHIGAYVAEHNGKAITFLDTPGHEAFTSMRARGANVTDIVMLVVAADDGVMPQTKEAIAHAKAADATIVVAMNKIDKPNANPNKVFQQLAGEGLNPAEWGGDTEVVPVSALTGDGIDKLLETLQLVAETFVDPKANPKLPAKGTVLEAKKTEGRGIVATMLVQDGTLHRGDLVLCGTSFAKVRMMFSDRGKPMKEAGPGVPCEIIGLPEIPSPGDQVYVLEDEKKAKEIVEQRLAERRLETVQKRVGVSAENIWDQLGKTEV